MILRLGASAVSSRLMLFIGQCDDSPYQRKAFPNKPECPQQQWNATERLHLGQADAPGVSQVNAAHPPQVRPGMLHKKHVQS